MEDRGINHDTLCLYPSFVVVRLAAPPPASITEVVAGVGVERVVVLEQVQTEAGAVGHCACAAQGALHTHGGRPCHHGCMRAEPERENVQAGAGNRRADSACFVIVFIIASHMGHVSGTD